MLSHERINSRELKIAFYSFRPSCTNIRSPMCIKGRENQLLGMNILNMRAVFFARVAGTLDIWAIHFHQPDQPQKESNGNQCSGRSVKTSQRMFDIFVMQNKVATQVSTLLQHNFFTFIYIMDSIFSWSMFHLLQIALECSS